MVLSATWLFTARNTNANEGRVGMMTLRVTTCGTVD